MIAAAASALSAYAPPLLIGPSSVVYRLRPANRHRLLRVRAARAKPAWERHGLLYEARSWPAPGKYYRTAKAKKTRLVIRASRLHLTLLFWLVWIAISSSPGVDAPAAAAAAYNISATTALHWRRHWQLRQGASLRSRSCTNSWSGRGPPKKIAHPRKKSTSPPKKPPIWKRKARLKGL